ncbi:MAG: methylenetetrahydrofolate reductase [NAD(P)H] [Phycisphaeraceae bacterium]|nr:methylenetetrahydrofolate reductase [NAD(P)H] [Phycisphaerales bacterium]MCB9860802.1 methylenetetrahydrofolate reductase [NAD(P)H] [Phycisphaeraceae bacterium]
MQVAEAFERSRTTFSFEFFPPKDESGFASLFDSIKELESLRPSFVSVTYGAGGSTRERTHDLVVRLKKDSPLEPIPHLTCVGHTRDEIRGVLDQYAQAGISGIMALRGDVPTNGNTEMVEPWKDFKFAADLVSFVRAFNDEHSRATDRKQFAIGVAGYPEGHPAMPNRMREMDLLKAKVDAGADFIVTQMFFDNRDFYDFRDRCRLAGIKVPILAGVMPVSSVAGMERMAELAAGMRYPAALLRSVQRAISASPRDTAAAIRRVGIHWATEQSRDLLDHDVAGLHFYTLNKSTATREVYRNLGVENSQLIS